MAIPKSPPACVMLVAIFSRHDWALDSAIRKIEALWGTSGLTSPRFDHSETGYYTREMGPGLQKQFLILEHFYDPARLADSKLQSNTWESELASETNSSEARPVNIDPGYLTLTKLVLASAKDRAHRIYLRDGIYAEECLYYLDRRWNARPWTYPDYQRDDFHEFFCQARDYLKHRISNP